MSYTDRLPSYLHENPIWSAFGDAVGTVFDQNLGVPVQQLMSVRDVNNFNPSAVQAKAGVAMLDSTDAVYEGVQWNAKSTRISLATMLGMNFYNLSTITDSTVYDNFVKYAVQFFPEQGTPSWPEFLGFATNTLIVLSQLWAELDATGTLYTNMQPEGSTNIGVPVWKGGTWFPTSHYDVTVLSNFGTTNLQQLSELLQFVAPINVVFRNIGSQYSSNTTELIYSMAATVEVTWL